MIIEILTQNLTKIGDVRAGLVTKQQVIWDIMVSRLEPVL